MNIYKRCFSFLLSLLLILSSVSVNLSFAQNTIFADVPDNHWASDVIAKWSGERYNVLKGDGKGNFHPNKGLTLGEFTTILSKTFGYTQRVSAEVTPMWAKDSIEKAIAAGILPKTDTVNANQIVTRQQAIKYIALAFSIQAEEGETLFADNKDISKEYKPYVKAFQEMGYVGGDNKDISKAKFNPQANYTRAEAMQVIDNTISDIIDKQAKEKIYPKNIIIRKENSTLENIQTKESLIIGQGAKDSKINIDKVEIEKSLIIYGGEEITVNSDNPIKNTIVNKPYKKDISLKGKFNTITVHDKTTLHIIGEAEEIILLGSAKATLNGKEVQSSTTENKKTNSNAGGTGSGGSGSGGNNPSIIVTSPFPTGKIENNAVDVKYTATPSKGATIKQVSYIINDDLEEYIYLSGGDGVNQKGTLGTGRVLLLPGENKVVFKVIDSSGKSATFDVKERPNFDYGVQTPKAQPDEISNLLDGSGGKFINNRIIIYLKNETNLAQTQEIVKYLDGIIIGKNNVVNKIVIRVQKNTEDGLKTICEDIKNKYSDIVEHATIEKLGLIGPTTNTMHTNDPWWNQRGGAQFDMHGNMHMINAQQQWGMTAINAPAAWRLSGVANSNIKAGIIDNPVLGEHEDLNIANERIFYDDGEGQPHGTHVMGIMSAIQNNNLGVVGAVNIGRDNLYAYNVQSRGYSDEAILDGLIWNIVHGCKVINVSLGAIVGFEPQPNDTDYERIMLSLIGKGYDFAIVQSAGNNRIDANLNGVFMNVLNQELSNRILVVGASNNQRNMADFSNHGERVDVVAPGVLIYSSTARQAVRYEFMDGTSMAAPHVAGVAAMVWSVNPALSGEQVKDIIVRSANSNGELIRDPRHNNNRGNFPVATYRQVDALAAVQLARGEEPQYETGRLVGLVVRATEGNTLGEPISNATIALYSKPNNEITATTHSDSAGHYHINNIKPGKYYFYIKAEGYELEQVNVTIEPGVITNIHKLKLPKENNGKSKVEGDIIDNETGARPIIPVSLEFRRGIDPDLSEKAEIIQSDNGKYSIYLPAGNYTVTAKADGYLPTTSYVLSYGENKKMDNQTVTISPKLQQGTSSFRAVLTWGKDPYDLDSHLVGPTPDGNKFHIYFSNKNYHYQGELYNNLDVDDTSSYGPETVTMNKLVDGTYDYYVHDFTNRTVTTSTQLSLSEARIQLYDSQGNTVRTFNVPSTSGIGTIWHVFTLIVKDGKYTIVPVDKLNNNTVLFNFFTSQEEQAAEIEEYLRDDNLDLELNIQEQNVEDLNPDKLNNSNDSTFTQEDKDIIDISYLAISQISYIINGQSEQVIYKP